MNISIQSTYYPENPPKDFNEWIGGIVRLAEQTRRVRYNEQALEARANELARGLGISVPHTEQGFNRN
jgi:hypothetical protein